MSEWSKELPKQAGAYLWYGDFGKVPTSSSRPGFHVLHVYVNQGGSIFRVAAGSFVYPGELFGVFKPLEEPEPDLKKFGWNLPPGK